jgi:hypothetical protein
VQQGAQQPPQQRAQREGEHPLQGRRSAAHTAS